MIVIRLDRGGVSEVQVVTCSKEQEDKELLIWPSIRDLVQKINDTLEDGKEEADA